MLKLVLVFNINNKVLSVMYLLFLQPQKGRSVALSPFSTTSSSHILVAPFPGPGTSIEEAVSPSTNSVFSRTSSSSNESSDGCSRSPPETNEHTQNVEVEINNREMKKTDDNRVLCTSPEDLAKIEAFHNSISELAGHFTTILFSESGDKVLSSSK